jgi:hypothetical protein
MPTLSLRTLVGNAAAVFSGVYGAVTRRATQAGCSRQTVYDHARKLQHQCETTAEPNPVPVPVPVPSPAVVLDDATRRRFAVNAFARGISLRDIEALLHLLVPDDGPDHSTIGRWVADAAEKANAVLGPLDAACVPLVETLALDEVFFGGPRPWSPSSRRA